MSEYESLAPSELARRYNAGNNECKRLQEALNKRRAENRQVIKPQDWVGDPTRGQRARRFYHSGGRKVSDSAG